MLPDAVRPSVVSCFFMIWIWSMVFSPFSEEYVGVVAFAGSLEEDVASLLGRYVYVPTK